ncbi:MAG TPA: nucleotidyltransferase family protein [Nocardioides sp.]|nr:nucleotidyltransferase family protein [Nocardioides sp.]
MAVDPAAFAALCRLVRQALAVEEGAAERPVDLAGVPSSALLDAVRRHRAGDLLRHHAASLGLPEEVVRELAAWHDYARPRLVVQAMETVRAWRALADAGIDALVIKGLPLAVLTTGRTDARGAGDVDLFVDPRSVVEAHRVLNEQGWRVPETGPVEPGLWAWRHLTRWGNALTYVGAAADADLHWRLEVTPGTHPGFAVFWLRRVEADLGVGRVPTLAPADALRHLAAHREGSTWLRTLVDLRRLARDPAVFEGDPPELPELAVGYLAVARETVGLPDTLPASVAERLDGVAPQLLARARRRQLADVRRDFGGGAGSLRSLVDNRALSTDRTDLAYTAMALVLPAHTALPVRARTAWTGVPIAFVRRAWALLRALRGRLRPGAPCAEQPGRAA